MASSPRLNAVAALGCVVCGQPAQIHHVRQDASARDDRYVLPLCPAHHTNGGHGVAFHAGRKTWEANYGTQDELLAQVSRMLGEPDAPV